MFHWEIVTNNGLIISEENSTFLNDVKDIQQVYFTNGVLYIGIKNDLTFFVNRQIIDLKLKQKINKFFQYKTVEQSLFKNKQNITYHLGINTEDDKYQYKYTLNISNNIILLAEKIQNNVIIDTRTLELR